MPTIRNTSQSALVPPDGPTIPAGGNRVIADDEWAKKESNEVVKAWIAAGALVIEGGSIPVDEQRSEPDGIAQGGNDDDATLDEAELNAMTNDALKEFIESKGGVVKSTWNKAELVAQALEIQK